jgi:hypothetical protein
LANLNRQNRESAPDTVSRARMALLPYARKIVSPLGPKGGEIAATTAGDPCK